MEEHTCDMSMLLGRPKREFCVHVHIAGPNATMILQCQPKSRKYLLQRPNNASTQIEGAKFLKMKYDLLLKKRGLDD